VRGGAERASGVALRVPRRRLFGANAHARAPAARQPRTASLAARVRLRRARCVWLRACNAPLAHAPPHARASLPLSAPAPAGGWLHARGVKPNTPPHSLPVPPSTLTTCTVTVVPILDNNYAYLLIDKATRNAAVVDPADPYAVLRAVAAANVTLTHILTTHHHHDHAGACALRGAAAARAGARQRARVRRERLRRTLTTCAHAPSHVCPLRQAAT
jgi:hypothetical protein